MKATSNPFTISSAAAVAIAFLTQPNTVAAGALLNAITVKAVDSFDNAVATGSVTMGIVNGSLNGTLTLSLNAAGEATFSTLRVPNATIGTHDQRLGGRQTVIRQPAGRDQRGIDARTDHGEGGRFLRQPYRRPVRQHQRSAICRWQPQGPIPLPSRARAQLPHADVAVTLKLSSGSLTGTVTVLTNSSGQAIFTGLNIATNGTYDLIASSVVNNLSLSATSSAFTD